VFFVLGRIAYSKGEIEKMAEAALVDSKKYTDAEVDVVSDGEDKKLTIFEVAHQLRKRSRETEYESWKKDNDTWAGDWTDLEVRRIEATKEAMDDMENATVSFFTETLIDARNWKDNLIGFLDDIQRAIIGTFSKAFVDALLNTTMAQNAASFFGNILSGAIGGGMPGLAGVGAGTAITQTQKAGAVISRYGIGGVVRKPELAQIGEVPEAVVPLSGGRSIPVEMSGQQRIDFRPTIKNIIVRNEKEAYLEALNSSAGEKVIIQKVLKNRNMLG